MIAIMKIKMFLKENVVRPLGPYITHLIAVSLIFIDVYSTEWEISWPIVVVMMLFFLPGIIGSIQSLNVSLSEGKLEFKRQLEEKIDIRQRSTGSKENNPQEIIEIKSKYEGDIQAIKILDALSSGRYEFRSIEGIAKETGIKSMYVIINLVFLKSDGLAFERDTESDYRWKITEKGRSILEANIINKDKKAD